MPKRSGMRLVTPEATPRALSPEEMAAIKAVAKPGEEVTVYVVHHRASIPAANDEKVEPAPVVLKAHTS
jgi:hypothetical protein